MTRSTVLAAALACGIGVALPSPVAAQSAGDIIGEVLRDLGSDGGRESGPDADRAARACGEFAEDERLRVQNFLEARRVGTDNIEVTLRAEDDGRELLFACMYDGDDQRVENFTAVGDRRDRARHRDERREVRLGRNVDEGEAEDAYRECADVAEDRDFDRLRPLEVRERARELLLVRMQADRDDDDLDLDCLYDMDRRQAYLSY